MSDTITIEDIEREVRAVAAEMPDHRYKAIEVTRGQERATPCRYFNDDKSCGCIVGHALARLGIVDPVFDYERDPERWRMGANVLGVARSVLNISDGDLNWLRTVQLNQDEGSSFGEAVAKADQEREQETDAGDDL